MNAIAYRLLQFTRCFLYTSYCGNTGNGAEAKPLVLLKEPAPGLSEKVKTALTIYCITKSGVAFDFASSETCKPRKITLRRPTSEAEALRPSCKVTTNPTNLVGRTGPPG